MLPLFKDHGQQAIVLKQPGVDYFEHYWCEDIAGSAHANFEWLCQQNDAGAEVYYSTGAYDNVVAPLEMYRGRKSANCVAQRALFLDIDAKDFPNKTVQECKQAITAFIGATGIAPPTSMIASGGGIHCYWITTTPIALNMWQALAGTLVGACKKYGLKADVQCTTDRARILRVPGFINHKHGVVVEQIWPLEGDQPYLFEVDELCEVFYPFIGATPKPIELIAPANPFAGIDLSTAINPSAPPVAAYAPASWDKIKAACQQGVGCHLIQGVMQSGGQCGYDTWTGLLSVAAATDNTEQALIDMFGEHPEFSLPRDAAKASTFGAPRTCAMLEKSLGRDGDASPCDTCQFSGKIKSPIRIGAGETTVAGMLQKVIEIVPATSTSPAHVKEVERPTLPFPYTRRPGKSGVWLKRPVDKDETVPEDEMYEQLLEDDLIVMDVRNSSAGVIAVLTYTHPKQGKQQFDIPKASISSRGEDWMGILINNHVRVAGFTTNPIRKAQVSKFLQTVIEHHTNNDQASTTVEQFGPLTDEEDTFVYGDLCYRAGAAPTQVALTPAAQRLSKYMAPRPSTMAEVQAVDQTVAKWNAGLNDTIGHMGCEADRFVLMSGFGVSLAPLIVPARQRGGMVIPNSTEAGSGKTSMVARAIQMYTKGDDVLLIPNATKMAFLEQKVAVAGALPVCWDELAKTGVDARAAELVNELTIESTNRKARIRMTGTQTEAKWASWFYGTTNADPHALISANSSAGNGAIARVLSIKVSPNRFGSGLALVQRQNAEMKFSAWCQQHAHVIGQRWIEHFMQQLPTLRQRFEYWQHKMATDCPTAFEDGALRFSGAIVAATMTAAEEAARIGLHPFAISDVYAYALETLKASAETAKDSVTGSSDIIPMLLASSIDVTSREGGTMNLSSDVKQSLGVVVIETTGEDLCVVRVAKRHVDMWAVMNKIPKRTVMTAITNAGGTSCAMLPDRPAFSTLPKYSTMAGVPYYQFFVKVAKTDAVSTFKGAKA